MATKYVRFSELKPKYNIPWSRQHIRRKAGDGTFPAPVELGPGTIAWLESDLDEYQARLIAERDAKIAARGRPRKAPIDSAAPDNPTPLHAGRRE